MNHEDTLREFVKVKEAFIMEKLAPYLEDGKLKQKLNLRLKEIEEVKKEFDEKVQGLLQVEHLHKGAVESHIEGCEGEHIQQVIYSTYHKALTQICFGCKKIRTSLSEEDLK